MEEEKVINTDNEQLIWQQVADEFNGNSEPLKYHTILQQRERRIILDIENNHEVGFQAQAFTNFTSYLYNRNTFRFALYRQKVIDEIGKYLGMQDCEVGFREFDERFIIKTNDEKTVTELFTDGSVRSSLIDLPDLAFGIVEYTLEDGEGKAPFLELKIDEAISDANRLQAIYNTFFQTLLKVDS